MAIGLMGDAIAGVGTVLLPVATGLLLEELTFGGLVRLLLAPPRPVRKVTRHQNRRR
jgi:hypothetical protein